MRRPLLLGNWEIGENREGYFPAENEVGKDREIIYFPMQPSGYRRKRSESRY
jgi:hypothetical protein